MSSTRRGATRLSEDYYITPVDQIYDFLCELDLDGRLSGFRSWQILDPCAGGDSDNPMSYPKALRLFGAAPGQITTVDIRSDSLAEIKSDYLAWHCPNRPDLIITNPPFLLAEPIIRKALSDVRTGGLVVMLKRVNFLGSQKRFWEFWPEVGCPDVYIHPKRMGFTLDGKTDSCEYGHMVWTSGIVSKSGRYKLVRPFYQQRFGVSQ